MINFCDYFYIFYSYSKYMDKIFDMKSYRKYNIDLQHFNDNELINHWYKFGKNENRIYYKCDELNKKFDIDMYRKYNADLQHFNDSELIDHWYKFGKNENRIYYKCEELNEFSTEIYKLCNDDLKNLNDKELEIHFLLHGLDEKRIYSIKTFIENNQGKFINNNCNNSSVNNGNGNQNNVATNNDININSGNCNNNNTNINIDINPTTNTNISTDVNAKINDNANANIGNNNNIIIKNIDKKYICVKLIGGLGNQIFMLLNAIALSKKYNICCSVHKNYEDTKRKSFYNYSFFKNINIIDNYDSFNIFNEKEFLYDEINLSQDTSYLINGYFQSYKYFWNYQDEIKQAINIDEQIKNKITNILNNFNKKIIAVHLRLGDYLELQEYHPIIPIDYYKKALSYYNLNNYQIILFSDDIELAKKKLEQLNINCIASNTLFATDEEEFYALCFSDIRICANSSFSLMSCYFTEIFNFKENCEYIFPNLWFGPKGPKYNIDDIMPNYKFYVIDLQNIIYDVKYDVVTTIHSKDKDRYEKFLKYNKKFLNNSGKFYYVGYKDLENESNYLSENLYPFSKQNVIDYIKNHIPDHRWGWYYQQLLKLYIFEIYDFKTDNVLIFDSDILLLKNMNFFDENNKIKLYKRLTGDKMIHEPYVKTMNYILPNLNVNNNDSGICHMMMFNKQIIKQLFIDIEKIHNKPLWKVCLDGVNNYVNKYGYSMSILSEYELYYHYIKNYYFDKFVFIDDFKYLDIAYNKFDFYRNKNKYNFIADHHYQSRPDESHTVDNLIDINQHGEQIISMSEINDIKLNTYVNYLLKKYKNKNNIVSYNDSKYTDDNMLNILFNKLVLCEKNANILDILHIFYKFGYSKMDIIDIVRNENLQQVKNTRIVIDDIINDYLKNGTLKKNIFLKNITAKNVNLNTDKFYFGIVTPVFNRYYVTKIFLECLKMNVNFDSIIFCIVDDGSNDDVICELEHLNLNTVIVYCDRKNNIYGSNNTSVPGSLYPLTLYIGHELIKNNCKILGVLDSDAFINENYFNIAKQYTDYFDMDNVILSQFNSHSDAHTIIDKTTIYNNVFLQKNMVGGISQFYSVKLYEQFKYKFTGEESHNYWAYDYDFQISNFMTQNNKKYMCLENSNVQHIGIKTTMVRNGKEHNNNEKEIINVIHGILNEPKNVDTIDEVFDFDKNFIKSLNTDKIFDNVNKNINIFVDKIVYINLQKRNDRNEIMKKQFEKYNIYNYERFNAIEPKYNEKYSNNFINKQINLFLNNENIVDDLIDNYPLKYISNFSKEYIKTKNEESKRKYILGALGCKMSHLLIINDCINKNYEHILLLEDDAKFHENFNKHYEILYDNLKNINFNYDMVWLCPNWLYKNNDGILNRCDSYKYINENFSLVSSSISIDNVVGSTLNTAGLFINIKNIKNIIHNFENTLQTEVDIWYRIYIQSLNKTYTTVPNLITQREEISNIESNIVNYSKDIHYKTRSKFNIFTIINSNDKEKYLNNFKNNLQKMIGYEKIYFICDEDLYEHEILTYVNINDLLKYCNASNIKEKFPYFVNDNSIKYYYYMDINEYLTENYYIFDENNDVINNSNIFIKN